MNKIYENLFEKAVSTFGEQREQILHQLAKFPDEVIPFLLTIIQEGDKMDGETAIEIIDIMGYPKNEPAIPTLVIFLGANINDPRYSASVNALLHIPSDVVIPFLVALLLGKGGSYFGYDDFDDEVWAYTVEGICATISWPKIKDEYALGCCPAINYLLSQHDPILERRNSLLLEVIERVAPKVDYVIPTLLHFARRHQESKLGKQAEQILFAFKQEVLAPYRFLLKT